MKNQTTGSLRAFVRAGVLTTALTLASMATLAGCAGEPEPGAAESRGTPVDVVASAAARATATESFPAQLVAERRARVATRASGRIARITVDVGGAVRAGETIAVLDDSDVRARLESARAQRELAERSFRRIDALASDGAASEQERDEARARLDGALAAEREVAAQLDYVVVRAPFDGFVEARHAEPGDLAGPGMPLLTLVGGDAVHVEADLPAEMSGRVGPGDRVTVRVPGVPDALEARVSRVAPSLEPGSRRLRVEAELTGTDRSGGALVPGAYARLELAGAGDGSVWIPADAVVRRGQLTGVWQLTDGEVRLRWVRLGREREGAVEVLSGPPGELIVVREPSSLLRDGLATGSVDLRDWSAS